MKVSMKSLRSSATAGNPLRRINASDQRIARKDVQHVLAAQRQVRRGTCGRDECGRTTSQVDEPTCQLDRDDGPHAVAEQRERNVRAVADDTNQFIDDGIHASARVRKTGPRPGNSIAHLEVRRQRLPPTGKKRHCRPRRAGNKSARQVSRAREKTRPRLDLTISGMANALDRAYFQNSNGTHASSSSAIVRL